MTSNITLIQQYYGDGYKTFYMLPPFFVYQKPKPTAYDSSIGAARAVGGKIHTKDW